jgi:molybdopterin-guanine dinucleotide biosynthesis protein A
MRLLGAILAGGQSRRFGSDKAEALFQGKALLDHVADGLRPQVEALVVAGREWPGLVAVPDWPAAGLGPLGGLAGALQYAQTRGFGALLSCSCDVLGLPDDLIVQLGSGPAIVEDMPIVGLWPCQLADKLTSWLAEPDNRSVYRFADHISARRVTLAYPLTNVNAQSDLVKFRPTP